jgi:hypothetical protein
MKLDLLLRHTALLLVFSTLSQTIAFARKPPEGSVIRQKVADIGEGQQCRVKLVDGTQAKGIIVSIHADNFTLKTKGVDEPRRIDYSQITVVRKSGRLGENKVGIVVATVGIGVIVGLFIWFIHDFGG